MSLSLLFSLLGVANMSPVTGDAFQKFDEDGSDSIDMSELQNVIKTSLADSKTWWDVFRNM